MTPIAILAALCAVCAACCERPTDKVQQWADQRDVELEQTSGDVDWDKEAEEYVHRRYGR